MVVSPDYSFTVSVGSLAFDHSKPGDLSFLPAGRRAVVHTSLTPLPSPVFVHSSVFVASLSKTDGAILFLCLSNGI